MHGSEVILGKVPFHWIIMVKKGWPKILVLILLTLVILILRYAELISTAASAISIGVVAFIFILYLANLVYRWRKSGLIITDKKLSLLVHHKIFGHYAMDLYYSQVRDTAYAYPSVLAGIFKYGNFMVRSGIEDLHNESGITANGLHYPDRAKNYVNYVLGLPEGERAIAAPYKKFEQDHFQKKAANKEGKAALAMKTLQSIKGIKSVGILDQEDIDYIWQHEEEKNAGVFETLRRKVVLACTHDETLQPPADEIVVSRGEKHIFPAVPFPEIKEKNTISCSPSQKIHEYLSEKIHIEEGDATLLIGFDL